MSAPEITSRDAARFWPKVRKFDGSNACWEWSGARDANGYGWFYVAGRGIRAHRASYQIHRGPIPADMLVLHRCDNEPCVRPSHLYLGDRIQNARDVHDRQPAWRRRDREAVLAANGKAS